MDVKCEIVNGVSKKTGKAYTALKLIFSNGYEKLVFLELAEQYMLEALPV